MLTLGRRCTGKSKYCAKLCTCSILHVILVAASTCVLWNEYFSFVFHRIMWADLKQVPGDTESVKLLLVADPQLIGVVNSNAYSPHLKAVAMQDADRYLANGFSQAYRHVQPDAVIFLGDLFNEGSTAYLTDFINYYVRFQNIFKTDPEVKYVYIWGDNDVGGEAFDPKIVEKMERFRKMFQNVEDPKDKLWALDTVKNVDFIKVDQDFGVTLGKKEIEKLEGIASASKGHFKVLLNHMTLFYDVLSVVHRIVHTLNADVIFSAHIHMSKIIKCQKCTEKSIKFSNFPYYNEIVIAEPGNVYTFDLKNKSEMIEIIVPTCSYRNGEAKTGFGAAVIGGDGILQYTVLSLPHRYSHFFIYGLLSLLTICIAVIKLCDKCFNRNSSNRSLGLKLPLKLR